MTWKGCTGTLEACLLLSVSTDSLFQSITKDQGMHIEERANKRSRLTLDITTRTIKSMLDYPLSTSRPQVHAMSCFECVTTTTCSTNSSGSSAPNLASRFNRRLRWVSWHALTKSVKCNTLIQLADAEYSREDETYPHTTIATAAMTSEANIRPLMAVVHSVASLALHETES